MTDKQAGPTGETEKQQQLTLEELDKKICFCLNTMNANKADTNRRLEYMNYRLKNIEKKMKKESKEVDYMELMKIVLPLLTFIKETMDDDN